MGDIETVINYTRKLETLLVEKYRAEGKGLHEKTSSVEQHLPSEVVRKLRFIASVRNKMMHQDGYVLDDRQHFSNSCESVLASINARQSTATSLANGTETKVDSTASQEAKPKADQSSILTVVLTPLIVVLAIPALVMYLPFWVVYIPLLSAFSPGFAEVNAWVIALQLIAVAFGFTTRKEAGEKYRIYLFNVFIYAAIVAYVQHFLHGTTSLVLWAVLLCSAAVFAGLAWMIASFSSAETNNSESSDVAEIQESEVVPIDSDGDSRGHKYDFDWQTPRSKFSDLAGMAPLKTELLNAIKPFQSYSKNGPVADRNGILLSGPPGNGKSAFAIAIAGELDLPFVKVSGVDLTSKWINESSAVLKSLFQQAREKPCVIFIDEFDSIGKSRGNSGRHDEDNKVVTALLTLLDDARRSNIVVLAATNYLDDLDAALVRDGRFDYRIEVPFPDLPAREGILRGLLNKYKLEAEESTIKYVAALWERRSVAFIESTVKRLRDAGNGTNGDLANVEAFKAASREASRRAGNIPTTGAKLSELALTAEVKREASSLIYRLKNWEKISDQGGEPPSGVLLYGPPGTGKTNFVRALARELEYWHIFEVNATEVLNDPRKFRDIVELAGNHRPSIVFIDEADELLRDRTYSNSPGATNEILKSMDGIMGKVPEVLFVAATNNAEVIDGAALRGGRFGEKIFMGPLEGDDLLLFLRQEFQAKDKVKFAPDLTPESMAARLQRAAPADILSVLRKAINYTFHLDGSVRPVNMADIEKALVSTQL